MWLCGCEGDSVNTNTTRQRQIFAGNCGAQELVCLLMVGVITFLLQVILKEINWNWHSG